MSRPEQIVLHDPASFAGMRAAGLLASQTLDYITPHVQPGISTGALDKLCHDFIVAHGAIPAPLGYKGFPKSICTSVNHVVCHGIPSDDKILKDGDIVNIDVTTIVDGWHGDTSRMYRVGKNVSKLADRLCTVTYDCLMKAIDIVRPGIHLGDIGAVIQEHAEANRFSVVRDFCGHGLGKVFHMAPSVLHYGRRGTGNILEEGMFFTIEPMINAGSYHTTVMPDGWTAVTKDRKLSAQYEHSLGVTATGVEIFSVTPAP